MSIQQSQTCLWQTQNIAAPSLPPVSLHACWASSLPYLLHCRPTQHLDQHMRRGYISGLDTPVSHKHEDSRLHSTLSTHFLETFRPYIAFEACRVSAQADSCVVSDNSSTASSGSSPSFNGRPCCSLSRLPPAGIRHCAVAGSHAVRSTCT